MSVDGAPQDLATSLWEIEQIKQLKARYFRFVDARDWTGYRNLFTSDCAHYGISEAGPITDQDEYIQWVKDHLDGDGVSVHHGHMPEITLISPTEATGIWAMFDYIVGYPPGRNLQGYGHYHETYRKEEDGEWRISSKRLDRLRVDPLGSDE